MLLCLITSLLISSLICSSEVPCLQEVDKSCRCNRNYRSVKCTNLELPLDTVLTNHIPLNTKHLVLRKSWTESSITLTPSHFEKFRDIKVLDVSFNGVERIKPGTFNHLLRVEKINLSYNQLRIVEKYIWCGNLPNLKVLNLSNNKILLLLDETFFATPSLRHLDLRNNIIHYIGNNAFSGLGNLCSFKLSRCSINLFPREALKQLKNLVEFELVSPFQIQDIPAKAFGYNKKIRRLRLENIRALSSQRLHKNAFVGLVQLRHLILVQCNLTSIPTALKSLRRLRFLDLSKNPLDMIEGKYLKRLAYLEELILHQTNLLQITEAAFASLTSLKSIDLSNNRLTELQRSIFPANISSLQTMILDENWWYCGCVLSWIMFTHLRESVTSVVCTNPKKYRGLYFDVLLNASKTCFPPTIQFPAYNLVETFEGDNLSISCCGEGVPEPVAKWVLPTNKTVLSGTVESPSQSNLQIVNASIKDAGIYRCFLTNTIGDIFKDMELVVKRRTRKADIMHNGLLHFGLTILSMFLLFILVGAVVYNKFPQCIHYSR